MLLCLKENELKYPFDSRELIEFLFTVSHSYRQCLYQQCSG